MNNSGVLIGIIKLNDNDWEGNSLFDNGMWCITDEGSKSG
jgi:hypothetical protein